MPPLPVGLTDEQMRILFDLARPLNARERSRFLLVDEHLRGYSGEIGDGVVTRIAREAQRAVFMPPLEVDEPPPLLARKEGRDRIS